MSQEVTEARVHTILEALKRTLQGTHLETQAGQIVLIHTLGTAIHEFIISNVKSVSW